MDGRSWLWRRKSSEKETESSIGSLSSHSERFSEDQVYMTQNSQSLEHNYDMKTLSEKLSEALVSINAKEELVNQHVKVAEEAVSGWEKSEREVLSLKQQVEILTVRNSTLEDRVIHLDEGLKECLRNLRQTREEKDQILQVFEKKNSKTGNSLMSIDTDKLYHKLEMFEQENSDLKLKLSSMAEELEIRLIERDLSNKTAEQASKQHLDSIKKVVMIEAECSRLNLALQKANNHKPKAPKTPSFGQNQMDSFVNIDLMDDFLEMEKLVALHESSEVEEKLNKVESLEIVLKKCKNDLKATTNQLEKAESKIGELENELKISRNQFKESESKLVEREKELIASSNQFKVSESKLVECEKELIASRNQLQDSEYKLVECKKELIASRNQLQKSESKFSECENKLMVSRNQIQESESKLVECEKELIASRNQFKESESKLVECDKELIASRNQLQKSESKLDEHENGLKASRYRLEQLESKLAETGSGLEMAETGLEATNMKRLDSEKRCKALEADLEILFRKVESLENDVQKERELSGKAEAKCRELDDEVSRLENEVKCTESVNPVAELQFFKVKQDTKLAMAGSKFGECQKTIASLSRQLKALATLDDFLIDTSDS